MFVALRPMIADIKATLPRIRTAADVKAFDAALKRRWSDAKIAALVKDVGAKVERAANLPWRAVVAKQDRSRRRDHMDAAKPSAKNASHRKAAALFAQRQSDADLIQRIEGTIRGIAVQAKKFSASYVQRSQATLEELISEARKRGLAIPSGVSEALALEAENERGTATGKPARAAKIPAAPKLTEYDGDALLDTWSKQAASLIKSVREEIAETLRVDVLHAIEHDIDPATLAAKWIARGVPVKFGTVEGRMKVIAQNQIARLNMDVQTARAQSIGASDFVWHHSGQASPPARAEHRALDGTRCSYAKPPKGVKPGQLPNCKCWAETVIPDDVAAALGLGSIFER